MSEQSVEITVNGKTISAEPGEMVIAAAERAATASLAVRVMS